MTRGHDVSALYLELDGLDRLIEALRSRGYTLVGPTVRDGAIVYDELTSARDLPTGWTDEQDGGTYRLERRGDDARFGFVVGPHSWKKVLFPSTLRLWSARREDGAGSLRIIPEPEETTRYAFIGVRSCELHAIAVQDKVLMDGEYADPHYRGMRERLFTVAVHCGQAGGTCFCVSMKTGPRATSGYDLALTELQEDGSHGFVVQVGTERGAEIMGDVAGREARATEVAASERATETAVSQMGRVMDTGGLKELLYDNPDHPRWDDVAGRCLSCGNCTLACPTCFCVDVHDKTDLGGTGAERTRRWGSCFTVDHSYVHGGSLRRSTKSMYRQWMTHKLASWIDQFGTSGCVGCGRCITWCPVGIDITEEVRAIRRSAAENPRPDGDR